MKLSTAVAASIAWLTILVERGREILVMVEKIRLALVIEDGMMDGPAATGRFIQDHSALFERSQRR